MWIYFKVVGLILWEPWYCKIAISIVVGRWGAYNYGEICPLPTGTGTPILGLETIQLKCYKTLDLE